MTDIYIKKSTSSKKPAVIALLILAGLALLIVWINRSPRPAPEDLEPLEPIAGGQPAEAERPEAPPKDRIPAGPDSGLQLLADAKAYYDKGQLLEARDACYRILDESSNSMALAEAEKLLGTLHITLVFSPRRMPEKEEYTIQSGDSLAALAKKFNTTVELIQKSNRVSGSLIRIGDRFRILNTRFSMTVDKSDNTLVLKINDRFFKRYPVGTGKYERTPVGTFKITQRIAQPTWWRPDGKPIPYGDPENVLGTHWLSLDIPGYGLHGTWEPETIGKQESQGCIRMLNTDIEELYALIPLGAEVVITE